MALSCLDLQAMELTNNKGFPLHNIRVKNTFIEGGVFDDLEDLDDVDDVICRHQTAKRQMSEPANVTTELKAKGKSMGVEIVLKNDSGSEPEKEADVAGDAPTHDTLPGLSTVESASTTKDDLPCISLEESISPTVESRAGSHSSVSVTTPLAELLPMPHQSQDGYMSSDAALAMHHAAFACTNPTSMLAANALAAANGVTVPSPIWANVYTVMLRNIPNKVNQHLLLAELDDNGFASAYDFLYLPIDPETNANKGYAFINFVDPKMAMMFRMMFEGRKFNNFKSDKVMSTTPAALQGFEANFAHYSRARVNQRELCARPLFLRDPQVKKDLQRRRKTESLIDIAARNQQNPEDAPHQSDQSPDESGEPEEVTSSRQPKFCHNCGSGLRSDFKFCQYCGAAVVSV